MTPASRLRDVLEGRLIWLALEVLRLGTNVVLDFGLWSRDEAVMCQRERMYLERAG